MTENLPLAVEASTHSTFSISGQSSHSMSQSKVPIPWQMSVLSMIFSACSSVQQVVVFSSSSVPVPPVAERG